MVSHSAARHSAARLTDGARRYRPRSTRFAYRSWQMLPAVAMIRMAMVLLVATTVVSSEQARGAQGELLLKVIDHDTREPLAVRMHLRDSQGQPVKISRSVAPGAVVWKDHFVFDGELRLKLRPGTYQFDMEHGPEYRVRQGFFQVDSGARDEQTVEMHRFTDMSRYGWWSGELHVHRPLEDLPLLMKAEDLHVAPVITWWNKKNPFADSGLPEQPLVQFDEDRFYQVLGGEDERGGGALLYLNFPRPLPIQDAAREHPPSAFYLKKAREIDAPLAHIDIEKPFWWDMPVWVASGLVDSIGLANNHQWRSGMLDNEAWGKPRDRIRYPAPHGNARWSQDIYYHLLNTGIRLPPSAGSASGVLPNPVGYNRVYVHVDGPLTYQKWFEGLQAGKVVVTNGPLLRPVVNNQLPGHVFQSEAGEAIELNIFLNLSTRDKIEYLEVVQNGEVVHEVRLDEYAKAGGHLPPIRFEESGWMLIRAVTNQADTFRFASTGPYYVEIDGKPRVSRASAQLFVDWVTERARNLELENPQQKQEAMRYLSFAHDFWQKKVEQATTE